MGRGVGAAANRDGFGRGRTARAAVVVAGGCNGDRDGRGARTGQPDDAMKADHLIQNFLRRHRWRARGTLLIWSAAATLGALALTGLMGLGWTPERPERS